MAQIDDPVMDLPPAYYSAIGEFLFRFAQVEYQLHEIIWTALDLDPKKGRTLTIGTDIKVLRGMVSTITSSDRWVKSKTHIQEMNSISGHVGKLISFRNQLAHGSWQAPGGNPKQARLHFMKETAQRLLPRFDPKLDDTIILQRAGKLGGLNHRAKKLILSLDAARPSRQKKCA